MKYLPASSVPCAALLGGLSLLAAQSMYALAFTGAEGFGANATGGSTVYHVTNLNDSGTGSFRDAVSASGRRVVFDLSGTIEVTSEVAVSSNTTIDGTTAPSPGITVHGNTVSVSNRSNVIVRNMRFREDDSGSNGKGSFQGTACSNIILDHCSIEWGRWDNQEFTASSHDITIQWSIIGEGIDPQYFGDLQDTTDHISIHHNLFIDNESRNPKLKANAQYINNVVYNWGSNCFVGGHSSAAWHSDIINNYFMAGPSSSISSWISECTATDNYYVSGNYKDMDKDGVWDGVAVPTSDFTAAGATLNAAPNQSPSVPVTVDSASHCLDLAKGGYLGCQPQDAVDKRLSGYVKSYGTAGQIGKP